MKCRLYSGHPCILEFEVRLFLFSLCRVVFISTVISDKRLGIQLPARYPAAAVQTYASACSRWLALGNFPSGEEDIFSKGRAAVGYNSSYLGPPQIAPINNMLLPLLLHEIYKGVEGDVLSRIVLSGTSVEARIDVATIIAGNWPYLSCPAARRWRSQRRDVDLKSRNEYCIQWETKARQRC